MLKLITFLPDKHMKKHIFYWAILSFFVLYTIGASPVQAALENCQTQTLENGRIITTCDLDASVSAQASSSSGLYHRSVNAGTGYSFLTISFYLLGSTALLWILSQITRKTYWLD